MLLVNMWIWTVMLLTCAGTSLDLSMEVGDKSLWFIVDGKVHPALQPDYAASSPCHPVNQFIDTDSSDTVQLLFNNTSPASSLSLSLSISSDSLAPYLTPSTFTLDPLQSQEVYLTYGCSDDTKGTHFIKLGIQVEQKTLEIRYKRVCGYVSESRFDLSMVILLVLAVVIVGISSHSASQPSQSTVLSAEESLPLRSYHAVGFILVGSTALVCLFFLGNYLIYILTFCITFSSFTAVSFALESLIHFLPASFHCPGTVSVPYLGPVTLTALISGCGALVVLVIYLPTRFWLLNNLIGLCFVFLFLRVIRLPGFNIGALFLFLAFFYDIFWVFYSEPIFGGNVMVTVATTVDLPIKLEWLRMKSMIPDQCSMLGLGDMVLPGLITAFARKYDISIGKNYYFPWSLVAYVVALVLCGTALVTTQSAQPALLYISPCLILTMLGIGWHRGDLPAFWSGKPPTSPSAEVPLSELRSLNA